MAWEIDPDFALAKRITTDEPVPTCGRLPASPPWPRSSSSGVRNSRRCCCSPDCSFCLSPCPTVPFRCWRSNGMDDAISTGLPQAAAGAGRRRLAGFVLAVVLTAAVLVVCGIRMGVSVPLIGVGVVISLGVTLSLPAAGVAGGRLEAWLLRAATWSRRVIVVTGIHCRSDSAADRSVRPPIIVAAALTSACAFPLDTMADLPAGASREHAVDDLRPLLDSASHTSSGGVRTPLGNRAPARR